MDRERQLISRGKMSSVLPQQINNDKSSTQVKLTTSDFANFDELVIKDKCYDHIIYANDWFERKFKVLYESTEIIISMYYIYGVQVPVKFLSYQTEIEGLSNELNILLSTFLARANHSKCQDYIHYRKLFDQYDIIIDLLKQRIITDISIPPAYHFATPMYY